MRFANLLFALSMATYFTVGSYTSVLWGDFYYTALFGYLSVAVLVKSRKWADEAVGVSIVGTIWAMYLVRPFIWPLFYEWIRFCVGFLIFIFTIIYTTYIVYDWHRKSNP